MADVLDHRRDPAAWAKQLGISREAIEIYLAADVIDLHVDSFIWTRSWGYRLDERHGHGLFGARIYSQVDLPRIREARVGGAVWSITTNPLRRTNSRAAAFLHNFSELRAIFERASGVALCRNAADYRAARAADKHAAFVGIQGGNALDADHALAAALAHCDGYLLRVTLVHLSTSALGTTSAPSAGARHGNGAGKLTARGRDYVEQLDAARVFVDLAHINRIGFWDAVAAHDASLPLLVSHTGVTGVTPHWRNLDDDQLRAVAETGGVVGIIYQSSFLGDPLLGGKCESIVAHLAHVVDTIGDDHAALGSDWDGAIFTPRDMPTCLELPRLVEHMLARGWSTARIHKILGGNFLRALAQLRPS
ncbi:MAG TPA: membrane dipeptidase [Kofleriaceae bacterium]|nr:membrane dipeptidase [Kofleriaceae bacterium]